MYYGKALIYARQITRGVSMKGRYRVAIKSSFARDQGIVQMRLFSVSIVSVYSYTYI